LGVNEAIYKQPLVLFLGAGASTPLGKKTTVEFLEWLKTQPGIDYGHLTSICNQIELSKEAGEKHDVEVILDHLEKLIVAGELFEKSGDAEILRRLEKKSADELLTVHGRIKVSQSHPYGSITRLDENIRLRDRIKDLVVEHYSEINKVVAYVLYGPLLDLAKFKRFQPLPVFTTNYDLAIEKASEASCTLIDGFDKIFPVIPNWSRDAYDNVLGPEIGLREVVFFKLHGSVDWVRIPSGTIQRVESRKRDPGGMKTEIVYPSLLKREIHEEPYRTNYDYLLACLIHAKVCAVIGFSFRDQEIVEEFRQAMELNKKLGLVIIDPNAKAIKSYLQSKFGFEPKAELIKEEFTIENAQSIGDRIAAKVKR